jgi:hypothetical protein
MMKHFEQLISFLVLLVLSTTTVRAQNTTIRLLEPQPANNAPFNITSKFTELPGSSSTPSLNANNAMYFANYASENFQRRRTKRNTGKGLMYGILGGAVLGGLIGAATYSPCNDTGFLACGPLTPESRLEAAGMVAVPGAIIGGLVGAIVGSIVTSPSKSRTELKPVLFNPSNSGKPVINHGVTIRIKL